MATQPQPRIAGTLIIQEPMMTVLTGQYSSTGLYQESQVPASVAQGAKQQSGPIHPEAAMSV